MKFNIRISQHLHPSDNELEYLTRLLYDGFYGFEMRTARNLNDAICGLCGLVGKVYYGDGNEKNCCSMKEVRLKYFIIITKNFI